MGNPGYAITYQSDKIREIKTTIKNGKTMQTKLTYIRGNYKVEFIFNSSTNLDHINLLAK
ncbi:MAG: YjgB family protein [Paenibacillus sp.]|jgi:hypothetical protein|nr:DUF4309 domain-containing protein [Paenibacillus sp.]MDR0269907.1 YjgB family protein [Paenibacillus sp.]